MDVKQDQDSSNSLKEFIKTEPETDSSQTKENEPCTSKLLQTFKYEHGDAFETETIEQFEHIAEIKEEIIECEMPKIEEIECEMPKIEQLPDLPTKIDHDTISENVQMFPIKQELESTSDVKVKDISDIKHEVSEYVIQPKTESELLTSHCDLPTLKIENTDYPDYYHIEHPCSSKSLKDTTKVILKRKRRYKCPICEKNFLSSQSRSTHTDGHFEKRYVVCQFCGKLMKRIEFFQHLFIHIVKKKTKCHIDDKPLKGNFNSKKQTSIDCFDNSCGTLRKPFKCEICFRGFNDISTLLEHSIIHRGAKLFKCNICSKRFKQKSYLQNHLIIHTTEKLFKCDVCSKGFNYKCNLQTHLLIHSAENPFKCDICYKGFNSKYHLQRHLVIHNSKKPFKCDVCSKGFNQKYNLQQHLISHRDEKLFKCYICYKEFTRKSRLQSHLIIHKNEKPFKCDICSKGFTVKSTLERHLKIHTGEKPFKCDTCYKRFKRKSHLKCHLIIHNGEKPFKCDICSKCFNDKSNLRRHSTLHNGKKSFTCDICSEEFSQKYKLKKHLLNHAIKGFFD